jgi:hypothetical protein
MSSCKDSGSFTWRCMAGCHYGHKHQQWRPHLPEWKRLEPRLSVIGCTRARADAGVNAAGTVRVLEIIRITVATGSKERILFAFTGRVRASVCAGQAAMADSINKGWANLPRISS